KSRRTVRQRPLTSIGPNISWFVWLSRLPLSTAVYPVGCHFGCQNNLTPTSAVLRDSEVQPPHSSAFAVDKRGAPAFIANGDNVSANSGDGVTVADCTSTGATPPA